MSDENLSEEAEAYVKANPDYWDAGGAPDGLVVLLDAANDLLQAMNIAGPKPWGGDVMHAVEEHGCINGVLGMLQCHAGIDVMLHAGGLTIWSGATENGMRQPIDVPWRKLAAGFDKEDVPEIVAALRAVADDLERDPEREPEE